MKKKDLKNLALKGLCGGLLLSPGLIAADADQEALQTFYAKNEANADSYLAGGSCGGGGCGGSSGSYAGASTQSPSGNYGSRSYSGCGGGSYKAQGQYNYQSQPQSGCGGGQRPNYYRNDNYRNDNYRNDNYRNDNYRYSNYRNDNSYADHNSSMSHDKSDWSEKDHDDWKRQRNGSNSYGQIAAGDLQSQTRDNRSSSWDDNNWDEDAKDRNDNWSKPRNASKNNGQIADTETQANTYSSQTKRDIGTYQAGNSSKSMTESDLMSKLDAQGKATYQSLTPKGKALALKLASQDTYKDKNEAVKEASRKVAEERNSMMNR